MQPIVDGIEETYGQDVDFVRLNAFDGGQGEAGFKYYALTGHPSIVIVEPDGPVGAILQGVVSREQLEQRILAALGP